MKKSISLLLILLLCTMSYSVTLAEEPRPLQARWQCTWRMQLVNGKLLVEYQLLTIRDEVVNLDEANIDSMTMNGAMLALGSNSSLWFDIAQPEGIYDFVIKTKAGQVYAPQLEWFGVAELDVTEATTVTVDGAERWRLALSLYGFPFSLAKAQADGYLGSLYHATLNSGGNPTEISRLEITADTDAVYIPKHTPGRFAIYCLLDEQRLLEKVCDGPVYQQGDTAESVTGNLVLPAESDFGARISWESSHPEVISNSGVLTRPRSEDVEVTLRASIELGSHRYTHEYVVRACRAIRRTIRLTIGSKHATVDNTPYTMDVTPYIAMGSGRTMVPVRFVTEALGAEVRWSALEQQVLISLTGQQIILAIGQKSASVNNETIPVDEAPVIVNGRTFIPLRFVSEALGASVQYDNATRDITIGLEGR